MEVRGQLHAPTKDPLVPYRAVWTFAEEKNCLCRDSNPDHPAAIFFISRVLSY